MRRCLLFSGRLRDGLTKLNRSTATMPRLLAIAISLLICGRVSSQRGRITEVQVREPIRQEGYPMPQLEDKHKFIHDGKEYDRAPNLFDVGGGKLKLLPEVFSNLGFESHDFVDDGTLEEQRELRDSRFWGRLYIYGWPAPIQYLRSHFGGPAVEGMRPLVLADPPDACEPLRSVDLTDVHRHAVVIAERGKCTFTTKAEHAQVASADGLLIVNNEEGVIHPPGPDGKHLDIFSAMIPRDEGNALIQVLRDGLVQGSLIPMNCKRGNSNNADGKDQGWCRPATQADRQLIQGLPLGGFMVLPGGEKFEYLLAEFGVKVPPRELRLLSPQWSDACTPPSEAGLDKDKLVLAARGGCTFIDKAEAVLAGSAGGAGGLIVVNNETSLFHMGAFPRWRGANASFPTLLVSDLAGQAISRLPADAPILLTPSNAAKEAAWADIGRLREAAAWPNENTSARLSMYETLISQNTGFTDRLSAVRQAFLTVSKGSEGLGSSGGEESTVGVEL